VGDSFSGWRLRTPRILQAGAARFGSSRSATSVTVESFAIESLTAELVPPTPAYVPRQDGRFGEILNQGRAGYVPRV
jgi:hypothetical protein